MITKELYGKKQLFLEQLLIFFDMKHHYLALATALLAATGVQADAKGTMTVNGSGAGAAIPVSIRP